MQNKNATSNQQSTRNRKRETAGLDGHFDGKYDWETIYGDGVQKNGLPGIEEEALGNAA